MYAAIQSYRPYLEDGSKTITLVPEEMKPDGINVQPFPIATTWRTGGSNGAEQPCPMCQTRMPAFQVVSAGWRADWTEAVTRVSCIARLRSGPARADWCDLPAARAGGAARASARKKKSQKWGPKLTTRGQQPASLFWGFGTFRRLQTAAGSGRPIIGDAVGLNPTRDRSQWDAATPCQAWCGTHRTQLADAFRLPRPDLAGPRMPVLLCVSASHFFRRSPFFPQLPLLPFFTSPLFTSHPKPLFRLRLSTSTIIFLPNTPKPSSAYTTPISSRAKPWPCRLLPTRPAL
jgi:hypothetical protein